MSLPESTISTADAATHALWRAAEAGNVDELVSVLPRVRDIDARNEHGVTALMRAAQHGRLRVVRVLLDHGADANIIRNDKFTALALAAFFGHTEVVRALMEHGADSQASTRNATSPHMWATARTFKNVVDELENPVAPMEKPAPMENVVPLVERAAASRERPALFVEQAAPRVELLAPTTPKLVEPVSRAVARAAAGSTVVRTLKDPPEIWDLVHPVPKEGFNARSAFVARLSSLRRGFAFRAAMVVVLASVCAVGVWMLRGVQARTESRADRQNNPAAVASVPSAAVPKEPVPNAAASNSVPVNSTTATPAATDTVTLPSPGVEASTTANAPSEKPIFTRQRAPRIRVPASEQLPPIATNDVSQPVAAPVAKTNPPSRSEQVATGKNTTPLSPQLIAPVKSATPKAKVIQWP